MRTIRQPSIQSFIESIPNQLLTKLRIENLRRIKLISIAGFCFLFLFLILNYLRFVDDRIIFGNIYFYLFVNHIFFFFFIFPLLLFRIKGSQIKAGDWKFSGILIYAWTFFISLLLLSLAILSLIERGSLMMYTLHVILINFCVLMFPKDRELLNLTSFFIITIACCFLYQNNLETLFINIMEIAGITLSCYIVSNQLFNAFVIETYNEEVMREHAIILEEQKQKTEDLLHNILPIGIANELKNTGIVKPKHYSSATIMLIDFKNFSVLSRQLTSEQLVTDLNFYFKRFDRITTQHRLEKIKTIGDAYLCVGGVPESNPTHPIDAIQAAQEIQNFLIGCKKARIAKGEPYFEGRIGIHTGPVVAGVVGEKKFAYDIWGDAVNVAARVESKGEVGKINISETTFQLIQGKFTCTHRGKIPIKNLEPIDMYFVDV